jgi:N-acetylglutamate synthase-like GNAT family acetyltransferase
MNDYIVRIAVVSDKKRVLQLLDDVFNKQQRSAGITRDNEFWNWKFEDNVFGKAIIHIIESQNQELLAVGTMWPWRFQSGVKLLNAYQMCDTVVSEKARGLGLFSALNKNRIKYAKENDVDFLFNFPNKNSLQGYLNMGWSFLGKLPWHIKVLKPYALIKNLSNNEQKIRISVPNEYRIDAVNYTTKVFEKNISIHKSNAFYNWRYKNHPSRDYGIIKYEVGHKKSFAIFTLSGKENFLEIIITDMFCPRGLEKKLLKKIIETSKKLNASIIYIVSDKNIENSYFFINGFVMKKNKNLVCLPINIANENKVMNIKMWDLFAGMHDSI